MDEFVAYRLVFDCEASTAIAVPPQTGSMLRGAFFGALRHDFCLNKASTSCLSCQVAEACPICKLVATVDRQGERGAEVPRPFALEPVLSGARWYAPGEGFAFGITLFGRALSLFPYAILAVKRMGEIGLGNRDRAPGRSALKAARVLNPLSGAERSIYSDGGSMVSMPDLPVLHDDVLRCAATLTSDRITVRLLTPLRLVVDGRLVRELSFDHFLRRLLRRLTDLYPHCSDGRLELDFAGLLDQAPEVRVEADHTEWADLVSYSRRRQTSTPVGGLVGDVTFSGPLEPFLPFLVWGQLTHVGKDTTRGNGWYQIAES
jgi:hypothetical protein